MTVYVIFSLAAQHNVTYSAMTEIKIWYRIYDEKYVAFEKLFFQKKPSQKLLS